MNTLRDYPTVGKRAGSWDMYARERGAALKLASSHLKAFARFKETEWRPNASVLAAAIIYCRLNNLPPRCAMEQVLCQLYEQKAMGEVGYYPPHTSPTKKVFNIFSSLKRAPRLVRSFA